MAQQALGTARTLLLTAGKPDSSSQDRRNFQSHLITLPSYRSPDCTLFFSTLVTKYFSEFDDLQDRAVDAVLDLCEDEEEQTRIIGIKGLGATARADPRWVRGNAGVLLQLLECPERELREVKAVLSTLLAQSPIEVLTVMADDCKGSEEETGASRRNIVEYLHKDCAEIRKAVLESGKNAAAESVFRAGFTDVLKVTAATETMMVLDMLLPLPSITGKTAKPEATNAYLRTLADSLKPDSSTNATLGHIKLFADLVDRAPRNIDASAALSFFGKHGGAVVEAVLVKDDRSALVLVKRMLGWVDDAISSWKKSGEGSEDGLVKDCVLAMVEELLACAEDKRDVFDKSAIRLEILLVPLYRLVQYRDRRKTIMSSKKRSQLKDLGNMADDAAKSHSRRTELGRSCRNIRDMADILRDTASPFESITPSWQSAPASPPAKTAPMPSSRVSSSMAPVAPRAPIGPRSSDHTAPQPTASSSRRQAPTGPRIADSSRRSPPHAAHANGSTSNTSSSRPPPSNATTAATAARNVSVINPSASVQRRSGSPSRTPARPQTPPRPRTPDLPNKTLPSDALQPKPRVPSPASAIPSAPAPALNAIPPTTGKTPLGAKAASRPTESASTTSSRGIELLSPSQVAPSQSRSAQATGPAAAALRASIPPSAGPSLADRLNPSPSSVSTPQSARSISIKRQRDDTPDSSTVTPSSAPSLLSRLSGRTESEPKRAKVAEEGSTGHAPRLSLRDRLNGSVSASTSRSGSEPALAPAPASTSLHPVPVSIPDSTSTSGAERGLSILNRSTPTLVPALPAAPSTGIAIRSKGQNVAAPADAIPTQAVLAAFSVRGRSTPSQPKTTSTGMSINGRSSVPPLSKQSPEVSRPEASVADTRTAVAAADPIAVVDIGPVRRKGRGFDQVDDWDMDGGGSSAIQPSVAPSPLNIQVQPHPVPTPTRSRLLPIGHGSVPGRGTVQPFKPASNAAPPARPAAAGTAQSKGSLLSRISLGGGN